MDEKPKYNWSYAVAFFLFDYPMLIVADWITDGWHNIHWGATAIEAAIVSVVLTLVLHLMQKLKRQKLQLMHISVFCGASLPRAVKMHE